MKPNDADCFFEKGNIVRKFIIANSLVELNRNIEAL